MNTYFALEKPKIEVDPDVTNIFLVIMVLILVMGLCVITWQTAPSIYRYLKERRMRKAQEANSIWYDSKESELHCGYKKMRIEPYSLEHFVCKSTFASPSKYISDLTIFEARDIAVSHKKESRRGVEQAVRRLNSKISELGIKDDLFKRSKERTTIAEKYRLKIIKD